MSLVAYLPLIMAESGQCANRLRLIVFVPRDKTATALNELMDDYPVSTLDAYLIPLPVASCWIDHVQDWSPFIYLASKSSDVCNAGSLVSYDMAIQILGWKG